MRRLIVRRWVSSEEVSRLVASRVEAATQPTKPSDEKHKVAVIPVEVAADLLYEVGWASRHVYIDLRDPETFARGRPKGAVNVLFDDDDDDDKFIDRVAQAADHGRVVLGGPRASEAAKLLEKNGQRPVLLDSFDKWRSAGLPLDVDGYGEDDDDDDDDDGDPKTWS